MRWDWYSASVQGRPEDLIEAVSSALGARVHERAPRHGYQRGVTFVGGAPGEDFQLAVGNFGDNAGGWQHIEASGDNAPAFAGLARRLFPGHRVTRIDACEDFFAPGSYSALAAVCLAFAREMGPKFKCRAFGDPRLEDDPDGRSLILGSRSSAVSYMLYEKGKQTGSHLVKPELADWVRSELRVRPENDARYRAASMEPLQAWGMSRWSRGLLRDINGLEVPKVDMRQHKLQDCERSFFWMVKQFSPSIQAFCELHGYSRQDFCRKLWELIDMDNRQKERMKKMRDVA